jgi:hypothetical protein
MGENIQNILYVWQEKNCSENVSTLTVQKGQDKNLRKNDKGLKQTSHTHNS